MTKEIVSIISIIANLALGLLKIGLGAAFKSSALLAEGLHSGIDVVSSAVTFLGVRVGKREPTRTHPYGWARAEVLAGFLVAVFLALAGLSIIWDAFKELISGQAEATITLPMILVMIAAVVVNGVLSRLKIKVGREQESLALIADGKHSQVDVLSSGAVLIGLVLTRYFPIADSLTALGVGIYILWETWGLGKEVSENLLDTADLEVEKEIKKVCKSQEVKLTDLRTRKIGGLTFAELEIALPAEVKISRADDLISELQEKLISKIPRLEYVVIQIKGAGKRVRMLRGKCSETVDKIGPEKKGRRTITPYKDGKVYDDFGAPEYLVIDRKRGKEVLKKTVKNPYYKIGRGHGVRFARAIQADEVKTQVIGENAEKALRGLGIKTSTLGDVSK
jgi:cation diffusion facilitator family transporter